MTSYLYSGPPVTAALVGGDVTLVPGKAVEFDGANPYFKRLIANGTLRIIPPAITKKQRAAPAERNETSEGRANSGLSDKGDGKQTEAEADANSVSLSNPGHHKEKK
jgi:hypothetical protein